MDTAAPLLVLVVGTADVRQTCSGWLLDGGFEVAEAVDGADALVATVADLPDLILTHAAMPGAVSAGDLCRHFAVRGVKVLVLDDGPSAEPAVPECILLAMDPPSGAALCTAVRRLFDHARPAAHAES